MMFFGRKKDAKKEVVGKETKVKEKGIYVLGTGCKKCDDLAENVKRSLETLGIREELVPITDFEEIARMGVMSTPALVIDYKVVSYGKVLTEAECEEIIKKAR